MVTQPFGNPAPYDQPSGRFAVLRAALLKSKSWTSGRARGLLKLPTRVQVQYSVRRSLTGIGRLRCSPRRRWFATVTALGW